MGTQDVAGFLSPLKRTAIDKERFRVGLLNVQDAQDHGFELRLDVV